MVHRERRLKNKIFQSRDLCLRALDTNSACTKHVRRNGRKMAERVRYRTKQQELIRDCLEKHSDRFVTAEQCMDCLKAEGIHVGQTTVYRALDRLTEENAVIKIPAVDGAGAQYRYIGELRPGSPGRLVCLQCGKIIPLECNKLHGRNRTSYKNSPSPAACWDPLVRQKLPCRSRQTLR